MFQGRLAFLGLTATALRVLLAEGPGEVLRRAKAVLARIPERRAYARWARAHDQLSESQRQEIRVRQAALALRPRISVLMPVYNTDEKWLRAALDSVIAQLYPEWELCIADDASSMPHMRATLEEYRARDSRIKVAYRSSNGHIAEATNSALALASGEFISLMDHDDVIPENALYELVSKLNEDSAADFIYSDEDKIDLKGRRFDPGFKPDWSPDYLESCMYTAHLAIYRKGIVDRIGGFRPGYDGAQDYDFALRFTELTDRVAHVPRVLYHWRAIPGSTSSSMHDKTYVAPAGVRALRDRLLRTGRRGSVSQGRYPHCFDVRVELAEHPLVSIVMPAAGEHRKVRGTLCNAAVRCVERIRSVSSYPSYEIVIACGAGLESSAAAHLRAAGCRLVASDADPFSFGLAVNAGAAAARGQYFLILSDGIEVIRNDWIEALLEQGTKAGVGAVGAKLLREDGALEHVGIVHDRGTPRFVRRHFPRNDPGYLVSTISVRNYLAVSGACLLTPAGLFGKVSGFDEGYKLGYGDFDYCLKLRAIGYRTVYTPHAELFHLTPLPGTAGITEEDEQRYRRKWEAVTRTDPYYNARYFRTSPPDFALRLDA
jgi:GT2 family glycosyltransferase